MADGRDEVAAARDWLRDHGVAVPDGAAPVGSTSGATGGDSGAGRDREVRQDPAAGGRSSDATAASGARSPRTPRTPRTSGRRRRPGVRTDGARSDESDGYDGHGDPGGPGGPGGPGKPRWSDGPDADPEQAARTIVLRKLTAQSRTRAELERALRSKEVPEEAAAAVLDRMGEVGLVDDAAFARDWVASRQQRRHLSRTALRRELQTKGVDREVIDEALADVGGADEHRAALDLARRRAAPMAGLPREVAYRRLGGVLARRGFSASVTARVLAEVLEGTHDE